MAGISQTHFTPESGKRKTRFRNNKTAVAERANFAVQEAFRMVGEGARDQRLIKKPQSE
mgnify:CR=1 FL=1